MSTLTGDMISDIAYLKEYTKLLEDKLLDKTRYVEDLLRFIEACAGSQRTKGMMVEVKRYRALEEHSHWVEKLILERIIARDGFPNRDTIILLELMIRFGYSRQDQYRTRKEPPLRRRFAKEILEKHYRG